MTSSAGPIGGASWPPRVGEPLPGVSRLRGVREKLVAYCLNPDHAVGGAKARGFQRILGVGVADVDYLSTAIQQGVLEALISDVRDNAPYGVLCEIRVSVAGLREHRNRIVVVTTSWELRHVGDRPRLVTAYIAS